MYVMGKLDLIKIKNLLHVKRYYYKNEGANTD